MHCLIRRLRQGPDHHDALVPAAGSRWIGANLSERSGPRRCVTCHALLLIMHPGGSSLQRTMGPHYSSASKRKQAPRAALDNRDAGTNPGLIILTSSLQRKDKPRAVHKYQAYGQTHTKSQGHVSKLAYSRTRPHAAMQDHVTAVRVTSRWQVKRQPAHRQNDLQMSGVLAPRTKLQSRRPMPTDLSSVHDSQHEGP